MLRYVEPFLHRVKAAVTPLVAPLHSSRFERQLLERLDAIEHAGRGAKAVYIGNNRLLTRVDVEGMHLLYLLEADDRLLMPHIVMEGIFEPEVTHFFRRTIRPTDHCLDVGANFGYYSVLMARLAHHGRVRAVEPDRRVFELLRDNVYINWCEGVLSPHHLAVSDTEGTLRLHRRLTRSGNTSIIKYRDEQLVNLGETGSEPFDVETRPLDSFLSEFDGRIDVLKIDVEGAEPLAFRGAKQLLQQCPHIKIVMEWSPSQLSDAGFEPRAFLEQLADLRLRPFAIGAQGTDETSWESLLGTRYCSGVLLTRS